MNIDINETKHWSEIPILVEMAKTQTLGNTLRAWRQCEGLRLKDVASKIGISTQLLSEYERGLKLPSIRKTLEMAELMGASAAMWVGYRLQDELNALGYASEGTLTIYPLAS